MKLYSLTRLCLAATLCVAAPHAPAQAPAPREVPAKALPVPDTVSPQMQKQIAAPLTPTWNVIPTTAEGWKEQVKAGYAATMKFLSRNGIGDHLLSARGNDDQVLMAF